MRLKSMLKTVLGRLFDRLYGAHLVGNYERQIRRGLVTVGRHTYGTPQVHTWRGGTKLHIGSFSSIADEVHILLGGDHPTDWVSTFPFRIRMALPGAYEDGMPSAKGDVVIGSDVWIGHGVTILSGVTIGNGAIVVAKSLVVKDVEPYAIVGGIPARTLRKRFSDAEIARLQEIAWWNWTDEEIREAVPLLSAPDLGRFLERADNRGEVPRRPVTG